MSKTTQSRQQFVRLCDCGCGTPTQVQTRASHKPGIVYYAQPRRFLVGHACRRPALPRFWAKVVKQPGGCWEWIGARKTHGYGNFCPERTRTVLAHRYAWEIMVGPIPDGMTLDHLCKNRACVNPEHLQVVSGSENQRRAHQGRERALCDKGHALLGENVIVVNGSRRCRICKEAYQRPARRTNP